MRYLCSYFARGSFENSLPPLVHTPETIKQLELLAASCQSKRAVLLEGDTCSKKSALVCELARLTRNELVVIPLNQDVETSDLLGQWLPVKATENDELLLQEGQDFITTLTKHMLLLFLPLVNDEKGHPIGQTFSKVRTGYNALAKLSKSCSPREQVKQLVPIIKDMMSGLAQSQVCSSLFLVLIKVVYTLTIHGI